MTPSAADRDAEGEQALVRFEGILTTATERVGPEYFQLPVAGEEVAVYRERLYCYELYHQMRSLWNGFLFSLGGEVDKGGHRFFETGPYAAAKPDFLVHFPGTMANNLVCIEVKPCVRPVAELVADLQKLTWFCRNAHYRRGILLVYGDPTGGGEDALRDRLDRALLGRADIDLTLVDVWHHASALSRGRGVELRMDK